MSQQPQLVSNLLLPELERQLKEDKTLWPNVKGLFIVTVTKKKKPQAKWFVYKHPHYMIFLLIHTKKVSLAAR